MNNNFFILIFKRMWKFICKILIFLIPIFILTVFTYFFYPTDKGELLRIGYMIDFFPNYRDVFKNEFDRKIYFKSFSDENIDTQHQFDAVIFGDSFSDQGCFGYKNYLGESDSVDILHIDHYLHGMDDHRSPLQALASALNGDFFDKIKVNYVILESVERVFAWRGIFLDSTKIVTYKGLSDLVSEHKIMMSKKKKSPLKLPTNRIIKFPLYNFLYLIENNTLIADVYRVKTSKQLFSVNRNELLFYQQDIKFLMMSNNFENIEKLNNLLNRLSDRLKARGIKLIVLPAPDKYDIYYDYIEDKTGFARPLFFEHMAKMSKKYIYIDSKQILSNAIKKKKDIYFYEDTHWSPWASQLIANKLKSVIKDKTSDTSINSIIKN